MKSGVYILNHDTGFKNIKKDLLKRYGSETTERIWQRAGANLEELRTRYANLPKEVKVHTDGNMFRNAALYLAIKEEYPDDAMAVLEQGVLAEGVRIAKLFSTIAKIPGAKFIVLPVFSKMLDSFFGEDAGFKSIRHCSAKDEVRFDITQCPYCKYLTEIGCSELVHIFCDIDEHIYGNFPGFEFERTGTIGTGFDKCDFCLRRLK